MNTTNNDHQSIMTAKDRENLLRLLRARKKLALSALVEQSARLKADFEPEMASIYTPKDSEALQKADTLAKEAVAQANHAIDAECVKLGILPRFAPRIYVHWYGRGENGSKERRAELRKVADTMIAKREKTAKTKIEGEALKVETEILAGALSEAGRLFLEQMPTADVLMPPVELTQVEALLPASRRDDDY